MSIWTFVLNLSDLNIHARIKKITLRFMLGSIPHQKFSFYHLPTRGRAGIKLGDAWYVSNVSIIFDCSMLYYLLFWNILGFIFHFCIIFGTNLFTGGPAQNYCFFAYFSVSQTTHIKRSPHGIKTDGELFWNIYVFWEVKSTWNGVRGGHETGGAPSPRGAAWALMGHP